MRPAFLPTVTSCLVLALAAGLAAAGPPSRMRSVEGVVTVYVADDFERGARTEVVLRDRTGRSWRLDLARAGRTRLATGDRVRAAGFVEGDRLEVADGASLEVLATAAPAVAGARSVVAIVLGFRDDAVSCTNAAIADTLWDGERSVDGLYREASAGLLSFPGDTDGNGQPDVFRFALDTDVRTSCSPDAWAAAGDAAATASGVDLSSYRHRLYVLPADAGCTWAGLASVGCQGTCRAWVKTCWLPDVFAHELGHNLGMNHASTDVDNNGNVDCEYCDLSDPMGLGGMGWRHFNGPHKRQMGWLGEDGAASVGDGGTIVLSSLEQDPAQAPFPQVYEVAVPGDDPYFLSYRRSAGYDDDLDSVYVGRTTIHRQSGSTGKTRLIARLDDGESFEDDEAGVTITQVSHASASVTVLVSTGCEPLPPAVSVSPLEIVAERNAPRSFELAVANRDSEECGATSFAVTAGVPAGWSAEIDDATLELAPGDEASVRVTVTAVAASPGEYPIVLSVTDLEAPAHGAEAGATFAVEPSPLPAVSELRGLSRGGRVVLEWLPPPGAGQLVEAYRVRRDGDLAGTTDRSHWIDGGLEDGTTYTYEVTPWSEALGEGAPAAVEVEAEPHVLRDRPREAQNRTPRAH
jgi:hypothetical protein